MKRGATALVVTAATAAVLAACTLTTSLDGLAGPPVGAPDATTDTATPVLDAAPDVTSAADAADASGASFCAALLPKPTFCDDFERDDPLGDWGRVATSATGTVSIARRPGGGRELVATQPAYTSGDASARLVKVFDNAKVVRYAFTIAIDAAPPRGGIQLMSIFVEPGGADREAVFVMVRPTGASFAVQTFPGGVPDVFSESEIQDSRPFEAERVVSVQLTLTSPPQVKVVVDGITFVDAALPAFFRPGRAVIDAGIHYGDAPSGPLVVHVDDVVIDVE